MDGVWRTEEGEGPLVVLVHGSMDRSTSFRRMARHLSGLRVVRYDRRGYGESLALGPPSSIDEQVDDLLDVIDGRPARVFGHSLGGVVALAAAERAPEHVARVVAYESPRSWTEWWPADSAGNAAMDGVGDPAEVAERFMARMIGEERWRRLPRATRDARRAEGPTLIADLLSVRRPEPAPYDDEEIGVPVVAAHGTASADRHVRAARELADRVPAARLEVVEGAGHGVHLTHPAAAAALLAAD